ncbi:hypothetical protein GBAR_LOCUS3341 [Geodia barretti]|uniref:Uncharacterized protein n=1 Tax=Geodia barretti TaxID=519541 RepID=A0AA35R389_GEOBA|nr:hypothetical protein GBAR_LOCUS3341 [Geodia barretti]
MWRGGRKREQFVEKMEREEGPEPAYVRWLLQQVEVLLTHS